MKLTKFLVMALMTPTLVYAQTTTNSIYIDQVGDSSNITITQRGQTNSVGNENERFQIQGNAQTITMTQDGNQNSIQGLIKQADNSNYQVTLTGDQNTVNFDHGTAASTSGSNFTLGATGSMNEFNLNQGTLASATGVTQTIEVTGDSNKYTSTINADDVTHVSTVTGDSNEITVLQNGYAGKHLDMNLTGNLNKITINQTSTLNVDSLSINSQSAGSTMLIQQCTSGC